jgi:hypothetical protein
MSPVHCNKAIKQENIGNDIAGAPLSKFYHNFSELLHLSTQGSNAGWEGDWKTSLPFFDFL